MHVVEKVINGGCYCTIYRNVNKLTFRHGQTWTIPRVVRAPRETRLHQTLRR